VAGGHEHLEQAFDAIAQARSVEQLRMAQAVVLPLEFGLSVDDTARVLGVSRGWVSQLRGRFGRLAAGEAPPGPRGGRRHAYLTAEQEAEFLRPYLEQAAGGGVLIVPPLKAALERRLRRPVAASSVYRLLHRHGWRKLAPDKRHPQADVAAREAWKKNSPSSLPKPRKRSRAKGRSG